MNCWSLLGLTILVNLGSCDKLNFMKDEEKWKLQKKKDYRNVEQKKDLYEKTNKLDEKKKFEFTTEKDTKNERHQLCESLADDDPKNALLKFGKVLHFFEDVSTFKKNMKSLTEPTKKSKDKVKTKKLTDKELITQKGGSRVKVNQGNFLGFGNSGRSFPVLSPLKIFFNEEANNFLEEQVERKKRKKKRDTWETFNKNKKYRGRKGTLKIPLGHVPQCYGWKYLTALEAMIDDSTVDVDYLSQSMSDMLDMSFSASVAEIFEDCENSMTDSDPMCPVLDHADSILDTCKDECNPQHLGDRSDCAADHYCCRALCGGYKCMKSTFKGNKPKKCKVADQFMQCVYQKIDTHLCSN